jgi:hypothetical protein
MSGVIADIARLTVGWEDSDRLADFRLGAIVPYVSKRCCHRFEKTEAWRPVRSIWSALHGINADAEVNVFFAIEPSGMIHVMACSWD